jgi:hypothetical protein
MGMPAIIGIGTAAQSQIPLTGGGIQPEPIGASLSGLPPVILLVAAVSGFALAGILASWIFRKKKKV